MKYRVCAERGCRRKAIDDVAPSPYEYVEGKHITLFGWTLLLYKEKTEYLCEYCSDCLRDRQDEKYREVFDAGYDKGYDDAPINY